MASSKHTALYILLGSTLNEETRSAESNASTTATQHKAPSTNPPEDTRSVCSDGDEDPAIASDNTTNIDGNRAWSKSPCKLDEDEIPAIANGTVDTVENRASSKSRKPTSNRRKLRSGKKPNRTPDRKRQRENSANANAPYDYGTDSSEFDART